MIIPQAGDGLRPSGVFEGVRPENLRIGRDHSVRVRLRPPWAEFFADLPPLGASFRQIRAPGIMLGQWGIYPGVGFAAEGPASGRELLFDFAAVESVYAFKSAALGEECLGFEVLHHNVPLHRIVVPYGEDAGMFNRIVRTHQARYLAYGSPEEGEAAEAPWQSGVRHRLNLLRMCPPEVFARVAPSILPVLLEMARREGLVLRTTVYTQPVIQAAEWVPVTVERRPESVFACDPETSLHLHPGRIAEGCLTVLNCRCCDRKRATLEFFDDTGRLRLAITSAESAGDVTWMRILALIEASA